MDSPLWMLAGIFAVIVLLGGFLWWLSRKEVGPDMSNEQENRD